MEDLDTLTKFPISVWEDIVYYPHLDEAYSPDSTTKRVTGFYSKGRWGAQEVCPFCSPGSRRGGQRNISSSHPHPILHLLLWTLSRHSLPPREKLKQWPAHRTPVCMLSVELLDVGQALPPYPSGQWVHGMSREMRPISVGRLLQMTCITEKNRTLPSQTTQRVSLTF